MIILNRNENRDTLPILKHPPIGSILEDKDKNAINLVRKKRIFSPFILQNCTS